MITIKKGEKEISFKEEDIDDIFDNETAMAVKRVLRAIDIFGAEKEDTTTG